MQFLKAAFLGVSALTFMSTGMASAQGEPVGQSAAALAAGSNDVNTPEANAVVRVGACTGTLITPDIVLTAGHCFRGDDYRPRPAGTAAFSPACGDWQRPDQWYSLGLPVSVYFGNDSNNWALTATASQYSLPVCIDMIMLRLDTPVPRNIAIPARVATDLYPARNSPVPLQIVGWGVSGLDDLQTRAADTAAGPWGTISHANRVTGMTAMDGMLYAATDGNTLWQRPADQTNTVWERIGHANFLTALAGSGGVLFAATSGNTLWARDATPIELDWQRIGQAPEVTAMAEWNGTLFATTEGNRLLARPARVGPADWGDIGHANMVVAMAAIDGMLYATQTDGNLWTRSVSLVEEDWRFISTRDRDDNQSIPRAMAAADGRLFIARQTPADSFPENTLPLRQSGTVRMGSNTCSRNSPISRPAEFCVNGTGNGIFQFRDSGAPLFLLRAGQPRMLVGVARQSTPLNSGREFQLFVSTAYNRDDRDVGIANIARWITTMAGPTGP